MLNNKNILITGALGQDGIILSKLLLKKKYNIFGIIKRSNSNRVPNVNYINLNLLDYKKTANYIDKINPLCLIHLGSENPNYEELNGKKDFYNNNLEVTKNLIKYCCLNLPTKKLILIGTSQMYKAFNKKINLLTKFKPTNIYAKFRAESFKHMLSSKKKYNSNMTMAILFNHDSKYRNKKFLIPKLIKLIKLKNFKKINEIYQENIVGDFSHAEDICDGLFKLILSKKNPNKLIFSSNKLTYINNIIDHLLKKNKIKKEFKMNNYKKKLAPIGDNSFTKKLLKWKIKKNIFIASSELNKL